MVELSTPLDGMDTENEFSDQESDSDPESAEGEVPEGRTEDENEGSQDTTPALLPTDLGEQLFGEDCCRVRLAARSNGRALLCGCSVGECTRRRHEILRNDPEKRGLPGLYVATWNSSQTIRDALEDTFRTVEQRDQDQARNRRLIQDEARIMRLSEQKERDEVSTSERMPATVGFIPDIEVMTSPATQTQASTTPRQDLMAAWRSGLNAPNEGTERNPRTRSSVPAATVNVPPSSARRTESGTTASRNPSYAPGGLTASPTNEVVMKLLKQLMDRFEELEVAFQHNERTLERHQQNLETHITRTQNSSSVERGSQSTTNSQRPAPTPPREKTPDRWYGVSAGRTLGVFTSWKTVCESVKGFPGATYKRFRDQSSAQLWLQQQWIKDQPERNDTRQDAWDDISLDGTHVEDGAPPTTTGSVPIPPLVGNTGNAFDHVLDAARIGPDGSVGKTTELYDTSIEVESEVLKLLCPKGVTDSVKRELVESAVDVVALPGKCAQANATESASVINQLSEALGDLATYQARRSGQRPPRDSQWRNPNRNALRAIKSFEDLTEATDDLSSQSALVMRNMIMSFKDILHGAGWNSKDSHLYCTSGVLTRMVQESLSSYQQLLVYLQSVALKHPDSWDEVTALYLAHHEKNLAQIRALAPTYTQLLVQVYIYLRDASNASFSDVKILKALTEELLTSRTRNAGKSVAKESTYTCAHCHGSFHEGGKKTCPLGELKVRAARRIAAEYAKITPADPAALERMIAAAKEQKET